VIYGHSWEATQRGLAEGLPPIKTAFAESATTWHCVRAIVYKISDDLPQLTSRRRDKDAARRLASTVTFERVMRPSEESQNGLREFI
jgi:hypothetical protein